METHSFPENATLWKNTTAGDPDAGADYSAYVSTADICAQGIASKSYHGIPIGNGIVGGLIWIENDHTLLFQINHVAVFGYNSASTYVLGSEDYGYGCGILRMDFQGHPFTSSTEQHLSLYHGKLDIQEEEFSLSLTCNMEEEVIALRICDKHSMPSQIKVSLIMLQGPEVTVKTHKAVREMYESNQQISLEQTFMQPAASGFSEYDHYCNSAIVIGAVGRSTVVSRPDNHSIQMELEPGNEPFELYIGTHSSMTPSIRALDKAVGKVEDAKVGGYEHICCAAQSWWADFWSKSFIDLPGNLSCRGYQKKWLYFHYLSAICMGGEYPAKFSGLFWNTNGLYMDWGSMFWGYNQECLHYACAASNHPELMRPYFKMHTRNYTNYMTAASQQWGSKGIFVDETEAFNGPERIPDDIVPDLQCFMLDGKKPTKALVQYASIHHPHISRWQIFPIYWTSFTTIHASEIAEHYWLNYLYTMDEDFLSAQAYPMLKGAAEFYRNFPNLKMEADNHYHIWRTNLHEHILGGRDNIDDLSFMRGVLMAAIKSSEILDTDELLRPLWRDILDRLTSYPLSGKKDSIGSLSHCQGKATWCQGRKPAKATRALYGQESPRLRMLENYDLLTLETRDQGLDHGDWELANQTFEAHPGYQSNMEQGEYGCECGRYLIDAAMLGRKEYPKILNNLSEDIDKSSAGNPNRLRINENYDLFQGYGIFAAGLQLGLMQSVAPEPGADSVIRVFPAWDLSLPANFKLLAKGGFLVSSSVRDGCILFVRIVSQYGKPCSIRNPWPDRLLTLHRNGVLSECLEGEFLHFSTAPGENICITPREASQKADGRD